jgi:hypothetical protein
MPASRTKESSNVGLPYSMSEPNDTKQSNVPKSANPEPPAIAEEIEAKGNRLEEVATKINVRQ